MLAITIVRAAFAAAAMTMALFILACDNSEEASEELPSTTPYGTIAGEPEPAADLSPLECAHGIIVRTPGAADAVVIEVPSGAQVVRLGPGCEGTGGYADVLTFMIRRGSSSITFDDSGVVYSQIEAEDEADFLPILDQIQQMSGTPDLQPLTDHVFFPDPTPSPISVNGIGVPFPPGASYTTVINYFPPGAIVEEPQSPHSIILGTSSVSFTIDGSMITIDVKPEDEAAFAATVAALQVAHEAYLATSGN